MIEILIVNQLVKHASASDADKISILRHDLYKVINNLVKNHKKLSTSSFYRSLKKLQDRGFLEEKKSTDVNYRNAIEVYPTSHAAGIIGFLMHFMVQFNQDLDILDFIESHLISKLEPPVHLDELRVVRIVDPSISMNSPTDLISSILPDAKAFMQIMARLVMNSPGVAFSVNPLTTEQIFDWDIENQSDLVVFPLYEKNSWYRGRDHLGIIDETRKLIRQDRYLLVVHLEEIQSDHHYIDIFKNFLRSTSYFKTYDSDELISEITGLGFQLATRFSYRGVSFLLLEKEE